MIARFTYLNDEGEYKTADFIVLGDEHGNTLHIVNDNGGHAGCLLLEPVFDDLNTGYYIIKPGYGSYVVTPVGSGVINCADVRNINIPVVEGLINDSILALYPDVCLVRNGTSYYPINSNKIVDYKTVNEVLDILGLPVRDKRVKLLYLLLKHHVADYNKKLEQSEANELDDAMCACVVNGDRIDIVSTVRVYKPTVDESTPVIVYSGDDLTWFEIHAIVGVDGTVTLAGGGSLDIYRLNNHHHSYDVYRPDTLNTLIEIVSDSLNIACTTCTSDYF